VSSAQPPLLADALQHVVQYMHGMGVTQSDVEAYKWFDLVAACNRD